MIIEGRVKISVPQQCKVTRFDGIDHKLTHCMKAVDFLIETPRALNFLEIKDPEANPRPDTHRAYLETMSSEKFDNTLKYKFRDSWMYLYGLDRISKPINYLVLVALRNFSSETQAQRSSALERILPLQGPNGPWMNAFAVSCKIFNLETWNRNFPEFPAEILENQ